MQSKGFVGCGAGCGICFECGGVPEAQKKGGGPGADGGCGQDGQGAVGLQQHVHACFCSE